jgi:two-component system CheB/CheR fusion protein
VTYEGLRVKDNGGFKLVNLTVRPVSDPQDLQGMIMVVFEDVPSPKQAESGKTKRGSKKKTEIQLEALEQELQHTKENLQTTIEELETSNEELKSTNEELQSTNEELQSTNEELETSKEELQSLNEELVTVNSELEGKIEDLSKTHNDLRNFMDSTEISSIFLDNELRIKLFTPPATKLMNVIETDMGRPIGHISNNLAYENLVKDAEAVLKTLVFKETEVRTKDGHWYFIRIFPYRTIDNVIDGVVITFVDIHELKKATEKTRKLQEYAESILDTVREPLIVLNKDLRVVSANRSFFKVFQVNPEETDGRLIYDLGNRQWDIPKLRELLEEIIPDNSFFEEYEVEHKFLNIGPKKMILNARKIIGKTEETELILLAIEDITKEKAKPRKG